MLLCYHSQEKPTEKATEKKEFLALIMTFELDLELQFAIQLHVYYHNYYAVDYLSFQYQFDNFSQCYAYKKKMNIKDLHTRKIKK